MPGELVPPNGGTPLPDRILRILHLEDMPEEALLVKVVLKNSSLRFHCETRHTREGLEAALDQDWDVVLCDYHLTGFNALDALRILQERCPEVPVVLVSGRVGAETAVEVMRAGARDYVMKHDLTRLPNAVRLAVEEAEIRREHRALREQLLVIQKREALSRLALGVAHDFNNLLTVIQGNSDTVLAEMPEGDPQRAPVLEILAAAERAEALSRQLLSLGGTPRMEGSTVSPPRLVSDVEGLLRRLLPEDIRLDVHPGAEDGRHIACDAGKLEQVLLNLAINARDAMPHGGSLLIRAVPEPSQEQVRLTVRDTGHGMDEATRKRIFHPFFTTKAPGRGTGLGLLVVNDIVRSIGGTIEVESEPGVGSSFHLLLPLTAAAATTESPTAPRPPAERPERQVQPTQVLLVEDDPSVRKLVRRLLEREGWQVSEARTVEAAREVLAEAGPDLALVISDGLLPDGTGYDLGPLLRERFPGTRLLLVSGYAELDAQGREATVDAFLPKPFTRQGLLEAVQDVLTSG